LLAVATGSAAAFWRLNGAAPPRLELSTNQLELEMATDAQVSRAAIKLKNVGGKVLTILGTTASCGCLKPELDQTTLAANAETELRVSIMNSAFATSTLKVDVQSDDPRNPVQALTIKIFKPGQTSLSTRQIVFQASGRSSLPLVRRVYLTATRDDLFDRIVDLSATTNEEHLSIKVIAERERLRYIVEVTLKEQAAAGNWRVAIRLRDRDGLVDEVIDVDVDIPSRYLLGLPEVVLEPTAGEVDTSRLAAYTVPIRYRTPQAGQVVRAELTDALAELLDVELKRSAGSDDAAEIRQKPSQPQSVGMTGRGNLRLLVEGTDSGPTEVVYLPVTSGKPRQVQDGAR